MLVISGGRNKKNEDALDDCWIFNITQHSWIKLDVSHSVSKRFVHSLSVFIMSPHCVWIITVGGYADTKWTLVTNPNIVMLTELVTNSKGEWTVGDTLDTNGMNNEEYKKKYQQQLQTVRRIWLEEYQKPRKGDTADIEQTIQALMKSLEEKEREAQVYHQQLEQKEREEAEKEQEIRRYCHQLQEKDREHQVVLQEKDLLIQQKDEEHQKVIEEKDRELQEKEETLQQKDMQHQVLLQENQEELRQKDRELQENQATLRQKDIVILEKDRELPSRVRHPNLVQFIGATKVDNPLILTELMSTSLNQEIRRNRLTNEQILSIAQDVALGLNYLHLFKPQPIIHRDVSSPNVLLKPCTGAACYEAKVADYGTAKLVQVDSTGTVMPGNAAMLHQKLLFLINTVQQWMCTVTLFSLWK
ncbi:PREDICTED: trichohyalin-like [Amphimedon queenslandica]|uniref:Protein kinase domain-containing protein n=1 Tax=Amphimedon queenslandica TaxID=400682 RepID=A0AAN0JXH4_AMPQE|nr:PREDICTED: trichohyalin-like [Amphimedon queenslandica]|eukprot:XP_019861807.1 PREDICTED: trichohyalin-like [Amphimedon queenslandica]